MLSFSKMCKFSKVESLHTEYPGALQCIGLSSNGGTHECLSVSGSRMVRLTTRLMLAKDFESLPIFDPCGVCLPVSEDDTIIFPALKYHAVFHTGKKMDSISKMVGEVEKLVLASYGCFDKVRFFVPPLMGSCGSLAHGANYTFAIGEVGEYVGTSDDGCSLRVMVPPLYLSRIGISVPLMSFVEFWFPSDSKAFQDLTFSKIFGTRPSGMCVTTLTLAFMSEWRVWLNALIDEQKCYHLDSERVDLFGALCSIDPVCHVACVLTNSINLISCIHLIYGISVVMIYTDLKYKPVMPSSVHEGKYIRCVPIEFFPFLTKRDLIVGDGDVCKDWCLNPSNLCPGTDTTIVDEWDRKPLVVYGGERRWPDSVYKIVADAYRTPESVCGDFYFILSGWVGNGFDLSGGVQQRHYVNYSMWGALLAISGCRPGFDCCAYPDMWEVSLEKSHYVKMPDDIPASYSRVISRIHDGGMFGTLSPNLVCNLGIAIRNELKVIGKNNYDASVGAPKVKSLFAHCAIASLIGQNEQHVPGSIDASDKFVSRIRRLFLCLPSYYSFVGHTDYESINALFCNRLCGMLMMPVHVRTVRGKEIRYSASVADVWNGLVRRAHGKLGAFLGRGEAGFHHNPFNTCLDAEFNRQRFSRSTVKGISASQFMKYGYDDRSYEINNDVVMPFYRESLVGRRRVANGGYEYERLLNPYCNCEVCLARDGRDLTEDDWDNYIYKRENGLVHVGFGDDDFECEAV